METPSMYLKCLSLQNVEVMACMQKKNDVYLQQKVQKLRWLAQWQSPLKIQNYGLKSPLHNPTSK